MNSDELREVDCDDECQTVRWKAADVLDANAEEIEQLNCLVRDKDAEIERLRDCLIAIMERSKANGEDVSYLIAKAALSTENGQQKEVDTKP